MGIIAPMVANVPFKAVSVSEDGKIIVEGQGHYNTCIEMTDGKVIVRINDRNGKVGEVEAVHATLYIDTKGKGIIDTRRHSALCWMRHFGRTCRCVPAKDISGQKVVK